MRSFVLSVFLLMLLPSCLAAQTGGHTLFGDIKVDESQTNGLKTASFQVLLYTEAGNLLMRQTVASNGRYRFLDLRNGRYEVVVEFENVEIARFLVSVNSPFKTDFRQDVELQWQNLSERIKPGVISAADNYHRSAGNAALFRKATKANANKHYDEAINFLKPIVENDAADFQAWQELGTMYFIQKKFPEAEQAYLQGLKARPNYSPTLISLGRLRIVRKTFDLAIEVLDQAVKVEPNSAQANYFLGEAYLQIKLGSKAVPYLNEAIRLDPSGMADAHLRLAALYHARNLKDKAALEYEEFLKQRPDYPEKKQLEAYILANKKRP